MPRSIIEWFSFLDTKIGESDQDRTKELSNIKDLLKRQSDREYVSLMFLNNLANDINIDYLKISHVLKGRDAFVYDTSKLKNKGKFFINEFAIGLNIENKDNDGEFKIISDTNVLNQHHVHDHLYVHCVINNKLYHHCYENFIKYELFDYFNSSGSLKREYLSLIDIKLLFDPLFNDPSKEGFKLMILVTTPLKQVIRLVKAD